MHEASFFGAHPGTYLIAVESRYSPKYAVGNVNGSRLLISLNYSKDRFDKFRFDTTNNAVTWIVNDGQFVVYGWNLNKPNYSYLLGAYNYKNERYLYVKCRYKSFRCGSTADMTDLDTIPVLDLSGRPCMYNQAPSAAPADDPSRFFYNQGTGEFTWGELET